jgi:predicted metal-dependent hydrolase
MRRSRSTAWSTTGLPGRDERLKLLAGTDPRHGLAITAANEHFTALFAEWLLSHPQCWMAANPA